MAFRVGLGPVFAYECLTNARRWQTYALRALFVTGLFAALITVYLGTLDGLDRNSFRDLSRVGGNLYFGMMGAQLVLVLVAAPAATAGAICLDRARGALAHLLVTDLSSSEIILGKLAARLLPVLGMVAATLPVLMLAGLLGGIDPNALLGAELISLGLAVFGCSLALLLSLHVGKTHEALMATYALWCLWLLARPITRQLASFGFPWVAPEEADPFLLAFAAYLRPGQTTMAEPALFCAVMLGLALPIIALAVLQVRRVGTRERVKARQARWQPWVARFFEAPRWLPAPRLDGNPVLWREWHRARPSRWTWLILSVYAGLTIAFNLISMSGILFGGLSVMMAVWVNGLQIAVGLLLLSVSAATSLAEERVRGSLDVLMTTTLSTREIVLGKWLGTYRGALWMIAAPAFVGLCAVLAGGSLLGLLEFLFYALTCGALVTSLGLALATGFARLGRAVGVTVTCYVLLTVGWFFLVVAGFPRGGPSAEGWLMASPFAGALLASVAIFHPLESGFGPPNSYLGWGLAWSIVLGSAALALLVWSLANFNRCLGRVEGPVLTREWDRLAARYRPRMKAAEAPFSQSASGS